MNKKAKKYIEDNTLDLNKNERMDTTGYVSLAVSIGKAYGALAIVEDDLIAKVADAWDYMSEMTRFDIPKVYGHNPFPYPEYIVGITSRMYGFKYGERETHYAACRGLEINQWLKEHEDVTNYVILDDDSDMLLCQREHFIKTHTLRGISKRDVIKAIKILSS